MWFLYPILFTLGLSIILNFIISWDAYKSKIHPFHVFAVATPYTLALSSILTTLYYASAFLIHTIAKPALCKQYCPA
jgi:hypothetical protein